MYCEGVTALRCSPSNGYGRQRVLTTPNPSPSCGFFLSSVSPCLCSQGAAKVTLFLQTTMAMEITTPPLYNWNPRFLQFSNSFSAPNVPPQDVMPGAARRRA